MPALAVNTSVNVSLPAGSSINVTGNGAWAFIATVSGREIASGSYVGPDVIGPFTRAAVVGLTATVSDGLQYSVADFVEGNSAAAALTTEQVTALQSVVSGDWIAHSPFRDTFKRADTVAGSIGAGWTAKGAYVSSYPLPAATDGEINSMGVECPAGLTTYWMRALPAVPTMLQCRMSWLDLANGQAGYQTFAMICTASGTNLIDDMGIHLTLTHTTLKVQERIAGGSFVDLMPVVDIQPRLSLADGENVVTVEIDAANNRGVVRLNERSYEFSSPNLSTHIGTTVAIEWSQSGGASTRYRGRILEFAAA